ncbi:hypothetical protein [Pseudorhodobacter sp.]|uniref:hypothetical protein n=1 Tax=Pseudorhodobacter sp. TaxID=1934400 RepID=UPI002649244C|nr:hypothetical protein [Pseudorhodobacter sp.]MDN5789114.1 hypothetical protein [Pseudorhodobacter sp.]
MAGLSATDLAKELGVSKGRVSQYVAAGQLEGCFRGDGRQRRFDPILVAKALGRNLDRGQMLGNGSGTKKALGRIADDPAPPLEDLPRSYPAGATEIKPADPSAYDMAKTQSAIEDARRKRRDNLLAEGQYVLADEVARQVARGIGQEIREFEAVLRDGARRIADDLGVDFLKARQLLVQTFRAHRSTRAASLADHAGGQELTEAEQAADS